MSLAPTSSPTTCLLSPVWGTASRVRSFPKWAKMKQKAKNQVKIWLEEHMDLEISTNFMFDGIRLKEVTETKRQLMFLLFIVYRFIRVKKLLPRARIRSSDGCSS